MFSSPKIKALNASNWPGVNFVFADDIKPPRTKHGWRLVLPRNLVVALLVLAIVGGGASYFAFARSAPTATPTPLPRPDLRHLEAKLYMLELINEEREKADVPTVVLGDNIAAQLHAENALTGCFSGHWGIDGLKPYMRYSLAGGYQSNAENGSGSNFCYGFLDGYAELRDIESEIRQMMDGWMTSPGHSRNILDRWHKKVNIGLAWDSYNLFGFQHFEGEYVEYDQLPSIEEGILSLKGRGLNEVRFSGKDDLGVQLSFDPPPHALTRGQVSRTYCYDDGLWIASIRYPLTGGSYWTSDSFTYPESPCSDPYRISADMPAPQSGEEAHQLWEEAYEASQEPHTELVEVPWITASSWTAHGTEFSVVVNIGDLLTEYGPGVYTIVLWGRIGEENVPISQYSIFYQAEPPETYEASRWDLQ